jgi:hypothetical protein
VWTVTLAVANLPSFQKDTSMLDWSRPLAKKSHPEIIGRIEPSLAGQRRRVRLALPPERQSITNPNILDMVWTFNDAGIGRVDGVESDGDLINVNFS